MIPDLHAQVGESANLRETLRKDLEVFHIADSEQEVKAREERRARGYVYAVDAHMNLRAEFLSSVLTLHDLTCIPLLQKCEIREEHIEAKQGIASLRAKIKYFFVFTKKKRVSRKRISQKKGFFLQQMVYKVMHLSSDTIVLLVQGQRQGASGNSKL